ncbi:MAG: hypothetical protein KA347_00580 [Bacteroidia bacterium]|jgi:hypothetical protein|nr:hypothetical protein [Bacteroidota bacterium]MBP6511140.1 hypothetical protein [Bacteroidia bacterium]MBP7245879.1 hypothetical protein [Bacteroidia bacterium]
MLKKLLNKLFKIRQETQSTGFYKIDGSKLILFEPINNTIYGAIQHLGYINNRIHIVHIFNSSALSCIGFKTFTKELIFVLIKESNKNVTINDITKEVNKIDWSDEYSSLNIEDILNEGIVQKSFDFNFLKSTIKDLSVDGENLFKSEKLGLYFQFENELLIAHASLGWDSIATKWLRNLNINMVKKMIDEANLYQSNEIDVYEEVNNQCESLLKIPNAIQNEFIPLHMKENSNINFYNLLIAHYTRNCSIQNFLLMNKGRIKQIDTNFYEAGHFKYRFENDKLIDVFN